MNNVPVAEWRVLPAKKARVVVIDEKREVRTQFAVFIAQPLGETRMRADEPVQGLPNRAGVETQLTCASGEPAIGAVQQHPHIGTTFGIGVFRHPPKGSPV